MGPKIAGARQRSTLSSFGKGGTKASAAQQAAAATNAKGKSTLISRSSSASDLKQDKPAYTKEQVAEADGREELDPDDPVYDGLWDDVMKKMGMPKLKPSE